MKHFHHVFTNIRHATIDQEDDLVKLIHELHKKMIYSQIVDFFLRIKSKICSRMMIES
jgi:hypothetical protein